MADPKFDPDAAALQRVRRAAVALPPVIDAAFGACIDALADARLVFLGAPRGYEAQMAPVRARLTRRLIERHGFRIVALDAAWVRLMDLDRYVRNRGVWGEGRGPASQRSGETILKGAGPFLQELRAWNLRRDPDDRAELRGLDVFDPAGLGLSVAARLSSDVGGAHLEAGAADRLAGAWADAQAGMRLRAAFAEAAEHGVDHLDAEQARRAQRGAARLARAARLDPLGVATRRQVEMFVTLVRLLEARGAAARAIVWTDLAGAADPAGLPADEACLLSMGGLGHDAFGLRSVSLALFGDLAGGGREQGPWADLGRLSAPILAEAMRTGPAGAFWSWRYDPELAQALDHLSAGAGLRLTGAFEAAGWIAPHPSAAEVTEGASSAVGEVAYPFIP